MTLPFRKEIALYYHIFFKFPLKFKSYSLKERLNIIFDYLKQYKKKRIQMSEYHEFEFEKHSNEFKDSFLGMIEQGYYLKILNPIKYYTIARNKYLTHLCLEKAGIPMPKLLGYHNPYKVNAEQDFAILINKLQENGETPFVIKATESSHGEGVYVVNSITKENENLILNLISGKRIELDELLSNKEELIIEELIKQSDQFNQFNKTSVNTIRFMTTLYPNGEAKIIATFIKIGRDGAFVDNAGSGGNIDANIDLSTGEINSVIQFYGFRDTKNISSHPDSGFKLEGTIIKNWDDIKSKIINFQKSLTFIKAVGWDIAITSKGPIVIEINDSWDRTGQLFIQRGWKLEIKDCYNEWRKIGYNPTVERFINRYSLKEMDILKRIFEE